MLTLLIFFSLTVACFATQDPSKQQEEINKYEAQLEEIRKRKPSAMRHKWPALAQGPENFVKRKLENAKKKRDQKKP
jgi:hypothetical protein